MSGIRVVGSVAIVTLTISAPAQVQKESAEQHQEHHPAATGEIQRPDMMAGAKR